jgi:hypothetical protein
MSEDKLSPENISFGGDVADFIGTLKEMDTGKTYKDSINPYGNPFEGKSPQEMVKLFTSRHFGKDNLEILENRVDDYYEAIKGEINNNSEAYQKVKKAINTVADSFTKA